MLVLTRRPGDSITLPELGIVIRVLEVRSYNQIRIGIEAPSGINIVRTELMERPHVELGDDKTLDCGSLGQITPNPIATGLASGIDSKTKNYTFED
jgi:carbon storage regulator CsrA